MPSFTEEDLLDKSELNFTLEDDIWCVKHVPSGVASQGKTKSEAHQMITEAVLLTRGEIGEPIETWEEEKEALSDFGFSDEELQDIKDRRTD